MKKIIYKLHYKLGITLAIFLIFMAVTGFLLNNKKLFNFDKITLNNNFIFKLYDLDKNTYALKHGDFYLYKIGDELFINENRISNIYGDIQSFMISEDGFIVANKNNIFLIDRDYKLLEKLSLDLYDQPLEINLKKVDLPYKYIADMENVMKGVSLSKFIIDLHSGRIFKTAGKILNDFIAILTILVVLTGFYRYRKLGKR